MEHIEKETEPDSEVERSCLDQPFLKVEKVEKVEKIEECIELKNIKYKTMLLSGNVLPEAKKSNNDLANLDKFLEDNKTTNQNETWGKLDKTTKIKKMKTFAERFTKENNYDDEENILLVTFLNDCLDRKKLQRVKDVDYDKLTGEIKEIPSLTFIKTSKHFTLKNIEKRVNTLKSLPPTKKTNASTIKNINSIAI